MNQSFKRVNFSTRNLINLKKLKFKWTRRRKLQFVDLNYLLPLKSFSLLRKCIRRSSKSCQRCWRTSSKPSSLHKLLQTSKTYRYYSELKMMDGKQKSSIPNAMEKEGLSSFFNHRKTILQGDMPNYLGHQKELIKLTSKRSYSPWLNQWMFSSLRNIGEVLSTIVDVDPALVRL